MFALILSDTVVAVAEDVAVLAAAGPGIVVALEGVALAAARYGYRLDVADGVPVVALDGAKARLWETAKARREAAERGGCDTPLGRVDTDQESILRITGAVSAAQMAHAQSAPFAVDWTMADNSVVPHDAPAMIDMGIAAMAHVAAVHARGRALRDEIEAADMAGALAAIDIGAGWPGST